jgi:ribosomal protein S18 acetylase RimI-like enzyme
VIADPIEELLHEFLREWLGAWPPGSALTIVGSKLREQPSWDGSIRPMVGVETIDGTVISVDPLRVGAVRALGTSVDEVGASIAAALDRPSWRFGRGILRWTGTPTPSDDPGMWLPTSDPRVPEWLTPFNGDVLVGFDGDPEDGVVAAGVGRKIHSSIGHELAVVTEEAHRGRGWAQRLVTQAARRALDDGAVPIYLHAEDNIASAKTADASGFPDLGWRILGLFPGSPS